MKKEYWEQRYDDQKTGWDINGLSTPLVEFIRHIKDTDASILIPGSGMSHEAMFAYNQGYPNIYVCDWVETARDRFFERFPDFPKEQFLLQDFFTLDRRFDYILEQTFFCALEPSNRDRYVKHISNLLNKNGIYAGLLFDFPLTEQGPPFGGDENMYRELLSKYLGIQKLERCYNSIKPRAGREFFFICNYADK